ncbi:hypothetical protein I3842_10G089600 [Carya illinoinensis]|uniref:K Homology domain-containing protein n=1 Tax=Carya illinoinensis TaxID=32201 RepID=A0A922DXE6_CARIL|nr:hypothetical protein I3842_10G089600 [Carya illinoinensis]
MGETRKRSRSQRDHGGDNKNQKRQVNNKDDRGTDKLVVYRILCPDGVIGSVIGKSGKVINSIKQETRAKVKVVDPYPDAKDRVITIYSYVKEKEEVMIDDEFSDREPLCAAHDALLKVHAAIANVVATVRDFDNKQKDEEGCQILVPSSQSANSIGKAGATIKKLKSKTRTNIKVMAKDATDPTNSCAMDFDNFVLFLFNECGTMDGESEAVKKALFAVSAIMYKFIPREEIPLETSVPEASPSIIIPSDVPIYPPGGLYPSVDPIVNPFSIKPTLFRLFTHKKIGRKLTPAQRNSSYKPGKSLSQPTKAANSPETATESADQPSPVDPLPSGKPTLESSLSPSVLCFGATNVQDLQSYADTGNTWPLYSSSLPVVYGFTNASQSEELIIRVLCPLDKIGPVIGKGRGKINDEDDNTVTLRLLLPSRVIGCIIGKSGSIINEIRKRTKTDVRNSKTDKSNCADVNDEPVEIILRLRDHVLKDGDGGHNLAFGADSLFFAGSGLSVSSVLPFVAPIAPFGHDWRVESGNGLGMLSSSSLYG